MKLVFSLLALIVIAGCAADPIARFDGAQYQWWRDHDNRLLQDRFVLQANGLWCLDDVCDDVARYCSPRSPFACVSTPMLDFAVPRDLDQLAWQFQGKFFCLQRTSIFAIPGGWVEGTETSLINAEFSGHTLAVAIIHEVSGDGDVEKSFFYSPTGGLVQYLDWTDYPDPYAVTVSLSGQCGIGCKDLEKRYAPSALIAQVDEPQVIETPANICSTSL